MEPFVSFRDNAGEMDPPDVTPSQSFAGSVRAKGERIHFRRVDHDRTDDRPRDDLSRSHEVIQGLYKVTGRGGVPQQTLDLVHLWGNEINGCGACAEAGGRSAKRVVMTQQLWTVTAWRKTPTSPTPWAVLALAEAMTRLRDRDWAWAVPDEVWEEVGGRFYEKGHAALILWIATTYFFNRVNTAITESAGTIRR
jgi:alkylhydroperoxidase family enzyme